jgi:hypothetical protein
MGPDGPHVDKLEHREGESLEGHEGAAVCFNFVHRHRFAVGVAREGGIHNDVFTLGESERVREVCRWS